MSLPTLTFFAIPTPPETMSAPESVALDTAVFEITVELENVLLPVIVSVPEIWTILPSSIVTLPIKPNI